MPCSLKPKPCYLGVQGTREPYKLLDHGVIHPHNSVDKPKYIDLNSNYVTATIKNTIHPTQLSTSERKFIQ